MFTLYEIIPLQEKIKNVFDFLRGREKTRVSILSRSGFLIAVEQS